MKLDKAIEILTEDLNHPTAQFMPELQKAEKLAIEALKRVKDNPIVPEFHFRAPLPGETEIIQKP